MNALPRSYMLERARQLRPWDVIVVGGGCTGLATALDASARGYRTLLVERGDFTGGTSSRSTKLVHGGVRYLRSGQVGLVYRALRERHLLRANAPHLVRSLPLIVPARRWGERAWYGAGLKLYGALAWRRSLGPSRILGRSECRSHISTLRTDRLRGGVLFNDGQFDDARLGWTLIRTAATLGCVALNHAEAVGLVEARGRVKGVKVRDLVGGGEWIARGAVVINAAGPFADTLRRMDEPRLAPSVVLSRGVHIVVSSAFLPGRSALLVPSTDDGRVLFAIPWHGHVLIGTTDVPVDEPAREPVPSAAEVDYLIDHAGRHLTRPIARADILSAWAGLRALIASGDGDNTAALSRGHSVGVSRRGLVTVTGGKWTTCRRIAEDAVSMAADAGGLSRVQPVTARLRLHGYSTRRDVRYPWSVYGADADAIRELEAADDGLSRLMHPSLPYRLSHAAWAARSEMAVQLDDVLARRTRALFLNARAASAAAPAVARVVARELGRGDGWAAAQVGAFRELARGYLCE